MGRIEIQSDRMLRYFFRFFIFSVQILLKPNLLAVFVIIK